MSGNSLTTIPLVSGFTGNMIAGQRARRGSTDISTDRSTSSPYCLKALLDVSSIVFMVRSTSYQTLVFNFLLYFNEFLLLKVQQQCHVTVIFHLFHRSFFRTEMKATA